MWYIVPIQMKAENTHEEDAQAVKSNIKMQKLWYKFQHRESKLNHEKTCGGAASERAGISKYD